MCGEHVPDRALFDELYRRHLRNPQEFWAAYPFPSVALDDAAFDRTLPHNSWGGASQALTALRAPRWMDFYGKHADLTHLMNRWVQALCAAPEFMQQLNPFTGEMSTSRQYSPAMLVLLDFVARLHGVRRDGEDLSWACQAPDGATRAEYMLPTPRGPARLTHTRAGATLELAGRRVLGVHGRARVVTDLDGRPRAIIGTAPQAQHLTIEAPGQPPRGLTVNSDQRIAL